MNVKSLITRPERGRVLAAGPVEVRGVAWTGQGHVTRVEVRIDRDDRGRPRRCWGTPSRELAAMAAERGARRRGRHVIEARATDSMGQVQPESPAWNKSGYLWNGFDAVDCEVR